MEIHQLDTTNIFLGILAIVSTLEFLGILIAAVYIWRTANQVRESLALFEMQRVAPFQAELLAVAHQVRSIAAHAEGMISEVHGSTQHALSFIDGVNARVEGAVDRGLTEAAAVGFGIKRAVNVLFNGGSEAR